MKLVAFFQGIGALAFIVSDCGACRRGPPPILFPTFEASVPAEDASAEQDVAQHDVVLRRANAELVAAPGTQLVVDGLTLRAAAGTRFVHSLATDLDADGDRDLIVTVTREHSPANIQAFRRESAQWTPIEVRDAQAPNADCVPDLLASYSPQTLVVRYARCGAASDAGVALSATASEIVALRYDQTRFAAIHRASEHGPPIANTQVQLDVQMYDHDQDGRDDVIVQVGAGPQTATAESMVWAQIVLLDRGTGLARDVSEPGAALSRWISATRSLASNRRRASEALTRVEMARRLFRVLCREAGAPRVHIMGEAGLQCGSIFAPLAEIGARALLTLGEVAAAAAMMRADTAADFGAVVSERFDSDLQRATPSETGITARQGPLVGVPLDILSVRRSALRLEPPTSATSVVVSGPQSTRVDLTTLATEPPTSGEISDLRPSNATQTKVVVGAFHTCRGIALMTCATADIACLDAGAGHQIASSGTLHFVTDLPDLSLHARCATDPTLVEALLRDPRLQWVGWAQEGMTVAFNGRVLRALGDGPTFVALASGQSNGWAPGSSASNAGMVVAGAEAIFVRDLTGRFHAWRPPQLQGRYRQLTDLTLSDDGQILVARLATTLWIIERMRTN